jgi:hypothetical protein
MLGIEVPPPAPASRWDGDFQKLSRFTFAGRPGPVAPGFHSGPNYGILKMPFDRSAKPGRDPFLPSLARRQLSQENP